MTRLLLALALVATSSASSAYQTLPSTLSSDMELVTGETYYLPSSMTVPEGITLSVQPGVVIRVNTDCCNTKAINVYGRALFNGTAEASIIVTSAADTSITGALTGMSLGRRAAINFLNTSGVGSELHHVRFRYTGLNVGRSTVALDSVSIDEADTPLQGDLSPNISVSNVSFGQQTSWRGYYTSRRIAEVGDRLTDLGIPYILPMGLQVPADVTVVVDANANLRLGRDIDVSGRIEIDGTAQNRVRISSISDPVFGGDIAHECCNTNFTGIIFQPDSTGVITGVELSLMKDISGTAFSISASSPIIEDVKLLLGTRTTSSGAQVVRVSSEGAPQFGCIDFSASNTGYVAVWNLNASAAVQFVDSYWQHPEGPALTGGDRLRVSGHINSSPHRSTATSPCTTRVTSDVLLDVDGDGQINPVIDGVLVTRYMAKMRGDDLFSGLADGFTSESAPRRTNEEIEAYLDWALGRSAR